MTNYHKEYYYKEYYRNFSNNQGLQSGKLPSGITPITLPLHKIHPLLHLYQDDEEFDVRSTSTSPMRIYVREILDNAPMDLEMGLVTRRKVSGS